MAKHYPGHTPDNTGPGQMTALLENLPRMLEMEAKYQAAALAPVVADVLAKMFGGGR